MNEKNNMVCALPEKEIAAVAKDLKRLYVMLDTP